MENWQTEFGRLAAKLEHAFDKGRLKLKQKMNWLDDITIEPYRGYGNNEKVYIRGRVLENEGLEIPEEDASFWDNLKTLYYRYESDEIPNAPVSYKFGTVSGELITDQEGYFEAEIPNKSNLNGWQKLQFNLMKQYKPDQPAVTAEGDVLLLPERCSFGLISDLDDTVIVSQATNFFEKSRILLLNNERSRKPFSGVSAFYRALQKGADQQMDNPVFYVSSSTWNLYDMFENFCDFNHLPKGVFLLSDVGLDKNKIYKSSHGTHKLKNINQVLETFKQLSFVLIGDSGQQDPEIYREIVKKHPGRILAVYIRDVDPEQNKQRDNEVKAMAAEVQQEGVPMLLVSNSYEAAQHAFGLGLIPEVVLEEIRKEQQEDDSTESDIRTTLGLHRIFG